MIYGKPREPSHLSLAVKFHWFFMSYLKYSFKKPVWILSYVCAKSFQSCLTLCDPMDCGPPSSSVHGILQARTVEWVSMPSSRGSSRPRNWTWVFSIAVRFLSSVPPVKSEKPLVLGNTHGIMSVWACGFLSGDSENTCMCILSSLCVTETQRKEDTGQWWKVNT